MHSYKILHIANFSTAGIGDIFYNTDNKIQHGLIEAGHFVYAFDYKFMVRKSNIFNTTALSHKPVHKHLIEICHHLKPDVIVIGHVGIPVDVLREMKRVNQSPVITWFVDTLNEPERLAHLQEMGDALDYIYTTTAGDYLKKLSELCPKTLCAFFPNISLNAVEYARPDWYSYTYDFIFCGSDHKRPGRAGFIEGILTHCEGAKIKLGGCLGNPPLKGSDYTDAVRTSLMGLNFSKYNDIYWYSSDRIAQLTGQGSMTLMPRGAGLEILYPENAICYFNDERDLYQKINFFRANPDKAIEIAQKGYQLAHTTFAAKNVTQQWINALEDKSAKVIWESERYLAGQKL